MRKGIFGAAAAFAVSPRGRQLIRRARDYLRSPEGQRRVAEIRGRVTRRPARTSPGRR